MSKSQGKVVVKESKNGQIYFNIVAENGQVLATSETYTSTQGLNKGIEAVKDLFNSEFDIIKG